MAESEMYNSLLRKSFFQILNVNDIFVQCSIPSKACLIKPFSEKSYHIETSHLICVAIQFAGFCMIRIFTEKFFRVVYTTSDINFSYQQRLYVNKRIKWFA